MHGKESEGKVQQSLQNPCCHALEPRQNRNDRTSSIRSSSFIFFCIVQILTSSKKSCLSISLCLEALQQLAQSPAHWGLSCPCKLAAAQSGSKRRRTATRQTNAVLHSCVLLQHNGSKGNTCLEQIWAALFQRDRKCMKCRKAESGLFLCLQVRTEGSIAAGNSWNVQARFWKSNPRENDRLTETWVDGTLSQTHAKKLWNVALCIVCHRVGQNIFPKHIPHLALASVAIAKAGESGQDCPPQRLRGFEASRLHQPCVHTLLTLMQTSMQTTDAVPSLWHLCLSRHAQVHASGRSEYSHNSGDSHDSHNVVRLSAKRPFELLNTLHPGWEVTNS